MKKENQNNLSKLEEQKKLIDKYELNIKDLEDTKI